ncbi:hypothetical protein BGZ76_006598, partial [Entomortierella beljakovae]
QGRDVEDCKIVLKAKYSGRGHPQRQYDLPTSTEVAVLMPYDQANVDVDTKRDILIQGRGGKTIRIFETLAAYDPLSYILIHPRGEDGWAYGSYQKNQYKNQRQRDGRGQLIHADNLAHLNLNEDEIVEATGDGNEETGDADATVERYVDKGRGKMVEDFEENDEEEYEGEEMMEEDWEDEDDVEMEKDDATVERYIDKGKGRMVEEYEEIVEEDDEDNEMEKDWEEDVEMEELERVMEEGNFDIQQAAPKNANLFLAASSMLIAYKSAQ